VKYYTCPLSSNFERDNGKDGNVRTRQPWTGFEQWTTKSWMVRFLAIGTMLKHIDGCDICLKQPRPSHLSGASRFPASFNGQHLASGYV